MVTAYRAGEIRAGISQAQTGLRRVHAMLDVRNSLPEDDENRQSLLSVMATSFWLGAFAPAWFTLRGKAWERTMEHRRQSKDREPVRISIRLRYR